MKGKKVLITGGLGFIGSNLAHQCLAMGADVTIYDCLDTRSGGKLYNIHDIKDSVELCYHDILDYDQIVERVVKKDIIFNCAASTSHPFSMREPWIDMDVNVRGVINLLEAVRRFNADVKFIQLGTSTQLGKLQYEPADEKHPEFPTDIYSANKSVSEKYVLIYANAYMLRAAVVRLSNVYGPRASIHSAGFTFNNYFVGLAMQGKNIDIFGEGNQLRNVIFVDDAVNALIAAALSEKTQGQALFAVGDHHYTVAEIAEKTMKCMGSGSIKYIEWPKDRKSTEVGNAVISNKKIKEYLNWAPQFDLDAGLVVTREYYKKHLKHYLA
ncbi:MAG: hypothetical protein CVU71_10525 [Deltaproteobacteria bacterium HGW-Deltaproteobacteria-6]|nr:MAG: hypothetical protein CVU71_10525 [Deltaproteobacteria bacterium HGW-Deltaproteobacteria-6]